MTEQEWLESSDTTAMLEFLKGKTSDRRLRLFGCACCRRVWKDLTLKAVREAVEAVEAFADGALSEHELDNVHRKALVSWHRSVTLREGAPTEVARLHRIQNRMLRMGLAVNIASDPPLDIALVSVTADDKLLKTLSPALLQDIFVNLFRPTAADSAWLLWNDGTVPKIAQAIYDDRAFDRLPILADALEEAGCDNPDILDHCRGPGPHVRGCWVVDLLLGKE